MATSKLKTNAWKLAGSNTGGLGITFPSDASEILIWISAGKWTNLSLVVSKGMLPSSDFYAFHLGRYLSASSYVSCIVNVYSASVVTTHLNEGGSDVLPSATTTVYYR